MERYKRLFTEESIKSEFSESFNGVTVDVDYLRELIRKGLKLKKAPKMIEMRGGRKAIKLSGFVSLSAYDSLEIAGGDECLLGITSNDECIIGVDFDDVIGYWKEVLWKKDFPKLRKEFDAKYSGTEYRDDEDSWDDWQTDSFFGSPTLDKLDAILKKYLKSILKLKENHKRPLTEMRRIKQSDDLIQDVFYDNYESAWDALWRCLDISEIESGHEYISRMYDFSANSRLRSKEDYVLDLEEQFGEDYQSIYDAFVRQMSDDEFKDAYDYIKRMYQ